MTCAECPVSLICLGEDLRRTRCGRCNRIIVSDPLRPPIFTAYVLPPNSCPDFVAVSILTCPQCTTEIFGNNYLLPRKGRGGMWRDFKRKRHKGFLEMVRKP